MCMRSSLCILMRIGDTFFFGFCEIMPWSPHTCHEGVQTCTEHQARVPSCPASVRCARASLEEMFDGDFRFKFEPASRFYTVPILESNSGWCKTMCLDNIHKLIANWKVRRPPHSGISNFHLYIALLDPDSRRRLVRVTVVLNKTRASLVVIFQMRRHVL